MRYKLYIPGPCEVDEEVLAAMAQPTPRHYGPEWVEMHREVIGMLKQVFGTHNDLYMVPAAGSALLDMAFGSMLAEGETVVVGMNGFFGERMGTIAENHGLRVVPFTAPLGQPLDPEELRRILREHPEARAVAVVHHETATTVMNPVQELAQITHEAGLPLILDAVSSLGGVPLPVDEWGIDVCVTVANKCLECPPGLAFISVSPRAWEWVDRNDTRHGWYLNLRTWRWYAENWGTWHPTPVTMPTNNVLGLRVSLQRLLKEGLEARFARYQSASQAVRRGLEALGFEMFIPDGSAASPIATAVKARPEFSVQELIDYLAREHGILISGGIGSLAGKIFRVGHMGKASTRPFIMEFLFAVEEFLRRKGFAVPPGASMVGMAEVKSET
ncbi:MAG: alanine--glyoxylate aminotransferase family protein [Anaerolineae bacterium]|nr:alanine--glyoxylate aminotransferase family protein [Anaerolineae bacterium]